MPNQLANPNKKAKTSKVKNLRYMQDMRKGLAEELVCILSDRTTDKSCREFCVTPG